MNAALERARAARELAAGDHHGHLRPLPGGIKARCGGPGRCTTCRLEQALLGSGAKRGASILDAVTGLARVKTAADLSAKVAQYRESGLPALERLRLVRDINALVAELGGKPQAEAGEPAEVKALRAIAKGAHDGETLLELYVRIQAAINALTEAGALAGDAESVAHDAITRWAELESQDA